MRARHEMSVKLREFAKNGFSYSVAITTKFYADHNAYDRQHDDFSVQGNNQPGPSGLLETERKQFSGVATRALLFPQS